MCSSLLWHSATHRHMDTAKHLLCVILQPLQFKTLPVFLNTVTATVEFWTCRVKICNTLKTPAYQGHTFQTSTAAIHFICADTVVNQRRRPKDDGRSVLFVTLHQYERKNRPATCSRFVQPLLANLHESFYTWADSWRRQISSAGFMAADCNSTAYVAAGLAKSRMRLVSRVQEHWVTWHTADIYVPF